MREIPNFVREGIGGLPNIAPAIPTGKPQVQQFFQDRSSLSLEIYNTPESAACSDFIEQRKIIHTQLEVKDGRKGRVLTHVFQFTHPDSLEAVAGHLHSKGFPIQTKKRGRKSYLPSEF